MTDKCKTLWDCTDLYTIPCGLYAFPNEKNGMCELCTFSQIQSHMQLCGAMMCFKTCSFKNIMINVLKTHAQFGIHICIICLYVVQHHGHFQLSIIFFMAWVIFVEHGHFHIFYGQDDFCSDFTSIYIQLRSF